MADLSYYRPDAFRLDLDHMPDQQKAMMAANRAALETYAGHALSDPGLPTVSGPASVRIIEDGRTTSHRLGMAEIVLAPHAGGPPQHRHARHDEGFYVVSGTCAT